MISLGRKNLIGISVYPGETDPDQNIAYLEKAYKLGYRRVFMSLLQVTEQTRDSVIARYKKVCTFARDLGYSVILDVAPRVFEILKITTDNLSFFNEVGATGVRFDSIYDGAKEAEMTYNPYGLDIEINISNGWQYLQNILNFKPNLSKLIACHNFYPQRDTGLDYDYFLENTQKAKEMGIRVAAFVSSHAGKHGPWTVNDGLPTLEIHRDLPITTQTKHLFYSGLIDDVIIGNAYATEEELKAVANVDPNYLTINVKLLPSCTKLERIIVEKEFHYRRGDITKASVRSTMSRVKYKAEAFAPHDSNIILKRGDVVVGNDKFGIYKGEMHVCLQDMKPDERKNLVGRVNGEEVFLLDYILPWTKFKLVVDEK